MNMAIEVKNLTKAYGTQIAVNDITFRSAGREIIGFLGPNGAGKSTTFKMLTAYLSPTSGSATINGYNIIDQPEMVRKSIGYLPESNPLYDEMYVKEFLYFMSDLFDKRLSKGEVTDLLQKVGLNEESGKKIAQLSKGYKQRVGFAAAILHDPPILILDEPTTGLDVNQVVYIRELIKELGKNKTILLSSHIMQEIEAVCNRVIILNKGEKIIDDDIETVKSILSGQEEIKIEFHNPDYDIENYQSINGVEKVNIHHDKMVTLTCKDNMDVRVEIFRTAVKNDDVIVGMNVTDRSIEQVFQQLTG